MQARGKKDGPCLWPRGPGQLLPQGGPTLQAEELQGPGEGWGRVVMWLRWGSLGRFHRKLRLTSAWQRLVPALRAHEAQGGWGRVPAEGGQLWLADI